MINVYWIKIRMDIFDDKKIKLILNMPEGNELFIFWLRLLTMAGELNDNGLIYITKKMPLTDVTLHTVTGVTLQIVRLALDTFRNLEMIEICENGHILIINWSKHQNIDGLDKIREQNKLRQQKFRNKQKLLNKSNVNVTLHNAIEENRIEKKKGKKSPLKKQDFIQQLLDLFCKIYLENRENDFIIANEEKERSALGKLLKHYKAKEINKNKSSDQTFEDFKQFFIDAISISSDQDKWIYKKMSPSILLSSFNEIKAILKTENHEIETNYVN